MRRQLREAENSRRRWRRSRIVASCVALAALHVSRADAQTAEPVAIDYTAPAGCPEARRFWSSIASRTPHAREASPSEANLVIHVSIEREAAQSVGRVVIVSRDGGRGERQATAKTCVIAAGGDVKC